MENKKAKLKHKVSSSKNSHHPHAKANKTSKIGTKVDAKSESKTDSGKVDAKIEAKSSKASKSSKLLQKSSAKNPEKASTKTLSSKGGALILKGKEAEISKSQINKTQQSDKKHTKTASQDSEKNADTKMFDAKNKDAKVADVKLNQEKTSAKASQSKTVAFHDVPKSQAPKSQGTASQSQQANPQGAQTSQTQSSLAGAQAKSSKKAKKPVKKQEGFELDDDFMGDSDFEGNEEIPDLEEVLDDEEEGSGVDVDSSVVVQDVASSLEPEEVILTDAEGRRYCRVRDCDQAAMVEAYCRYHYILFWKRIQIRRKILSDGKLQRYVEELTSRYPDKFLEIIYKDLRTEKDFLMAIQELEIDDSASGENELEDEAQSYIEEVRGMSETTSTEEDEF